MYCARLELKSHLLESIMRQKLSAFIGARLAAQNFSEAKPSFILGAVGRLFTLPPKMMQ
jgi:hypothetical protein